MDIDHVLEKIKSINFKGGIFGKTTTLLVVLCIGVSAVSMASSVWWMPLTLMLPLMGMVLYALRRCFNFAEKNPQAAIMEGAELLIHEKLMFAQKNQTENPLLQVTVEDHQTPELPYEDIGLPDSLPSQALPQRADVDKEAD